MSNIFWWGRVCAEKLRNAIFPLFILGAVLFSVSPQVTLASIYDPTAYYISSYDRVWFTFFPNGIPDIRHNDTVTIDYGKDSNMDIVKPPEVNDVTAKLFYISSDGQRHFQYLFYDMLHEIVPAPYVWTLSGKYEVDIYGYVGTSTVNTYLTTMKFTVVTNGGLAPTCDLVITPNTIYPKNGDTAVMEWTSTNATTATIDQGIGTVNTSDSMTISPNATTTYTASFTGEGGTVACQATVNVPDPVVPPLHERAAEFARKLVNHTEAYLWGGKGWDYDLKEFTTPERILSGYTYLNVDTGDKENGIGVDCSGLVTWAFNRANDPTAGFNNNYIKYVNADGMSQDYQSGPIDETELRAGDTMTFDWNSDGRMDHVAMYVGESGGYDVVNAGSPIIGIEEQIKDIYSKAPGFINYRRIHQADVALAVTTGSPVDLEITDPDGNTLSATNVTASDEEYIREIPGELYYLELAQGHDGRPEDMIISPKAKDGAYTIKVVPEAGASPTATYSLTVELNGVKTVVVENETIDTIPSSGFVLKLAGGEIQDLDSTIKVLLEDLYQTVNSLNLSSKQRKRGLLASVESALAWFDKNRTDQIVRKLNKLQNDIDRHVAGELTTEELENINKQINDLLLLLQS